MESFKVLSDALRAAKIPFEEAELRMIPTNELELSVEQTLQVLRMIETIEELDDVQNIFHAMHISDEAMAALENEA